MRLAWDVRREIHHAKAYIRLTPMEGHGEGYCNTPLLWGEFILQHETAPLVLQHFMKRFPGYVILLLVKDKAYAAKNGEIHETVVDRNAFALPVQRDEFLEEWLAFYQSQYIPERRNIKLMKRHIPKKYWGFMPETVLASDLRRASC
jgi:probable DNA metabolism protein